MSFTHAAPFGLDAPLDFPANPVPEPKTALGQEALALYKAAQLATQRIAECRDAEIEAATALSEARAALVAEVERGGREGQDQEREVELARELQARQLHADPDTHNLRRHSAIKAQRTAVQAWTLFARSNAGALIKGELEAEAERASSALKGAYAQLAPVLSAYRQVGEQIRTLANLNAVGPNADQRAELWRIAPEPEPPLPLRAVYDPEPEAAESDD